MAPNTSLSNGVLCEVLFGQIKDAIGTENSYELLQGWTPKGTKEVRLANASSLIEQGKVWLPETKPWIDGFISELQAFPAGSYDDQVDAMTQAIGFYQLYLRSRLKVSVTMIPRGRHRTTIHNAFD